MLMSIRCRSSACLCRYMLPVVGYHKSGGVTPSLPGRGFKLSRSWCYNVVENELQHRRQDVARDFTDLQNGRDRVCPFCDEIIDGKAVNGLHPECDRQFNEELAALEAVAQETIAA